MLKPAEEYRRVDLLLECFGWNKDDEKARFSALVILRAARREPHPIWDDFKVGKRR